MGNIGNSIADSASMGPRYLKRLLVGINDERFARFATPGGKVIDANHPAFILGHLCLYPVKVLELLQMDRLGVEPSERYIQVFSKDAKCVDDAAGSIYPARSDIVQHFEEYYELAIAAVRTVPDEQLSAPNPVDSPMRQVLPTLASVINFYLTGHVQMHLGQLSTWRRMEGLPPA